MNESNNTNQIYRSPTVIIFDLMDTIVADPFFQVLPSFFNLSIAEILAVKDPDSWPRFELGEIDEAEYFANFFHRDSGRQLHDPAALKAALFGGYRYLDGIEPLLAALRAYGLTLWVHSNYTIWVDEVRRRLALDRFISGYALSYQLRARKPAALAYQQALLQIATANGATVADCLFIDDRECNIEGARKVGLAAILFENSQQLRHALLDYGINLSTE